MHDSLTISEAAGQIRLGTLDPQELVEHCLATVRRHEDLVRAWVAVDEESARRDAQRAWDRLARGVDAGPLAGIPIGIKDIIDVAGWPTKAGSPLREGHIAARDAAITASLRRAGAVVLGKTVTVEFACFDPPPTRNPWHLDLQHTPGGSSSGSAVAVALGMCLGATGSQTGGSLVRPATYCGIAACKPTFGLLSLDGVVPVSAHLDHAGVMARSVEDLEILFDSLVPMPTFAGKSGPTGNAYHDQSAVRLGLIEEFFLSGADRPVRDATEAALGKLGQAGARIDKVALPAGFAKVHAMHRRIMAFEAAAYHRPLFPTHREAYGPKLAALLEEGFALSLQDYAEALAHQREFQRAAAAAVGAFDALIVPATNTTAPATLSTTGDSRFQAPWTYAGVPVISIPCGLAEDGLPVALQMIQSHGRDLCLFGVAKWCEERLEFRDRPPLLTDSAVPLPCPHS